MTLNAIAIGEQFTIRDGRVVCTKVREGWGHSEANGEEFCIAETMPVRRVERPRETKA